MRPLRKWLGLTPVERRTFREAVFYLWIVRLALWSLPFQRVDRWVASVCRKPRKIVVECDGELVTRTVRRAARLVPVGTCLTQALTTKILLARRGMSCEIRFGARKRAGRLEAHAWVERDGRAILGEPSPGEFAEFRPMKPQ